MVVMVLVGWGGVLDDGGARGQMGCTVPLIGSVPPFPSGPLTLSLRFYLWSNGTVAMAIRSPSDKDKRVLTSREC